jgi:hypothetical protein
MAGSVSTDFSFFTGATATDSSCDTVTDWSAGTVDTEIFLEGTGSIVAKVSKTTAVFTFTLTANLDLTDKLVIAWMNCATPGILGTRAGGGLQIRLTDNVGNYGWWYVAGNDTYFGSWDAFVIHTAQRSGSYYVESATAPDLTNIASVGIACTTTASAAKDNFWFDAVRYGTYLEVNSGTSGSPATFDDIETAELANYYGGVVFQEGVFFPQCQLRIGASGGNTYFEDSGKILVFRDRDFPNDFYDLRFQGGTGTTEIYFGDKVGTQGVAGVVFDAAGPRYTVTGLDTDIDNLGLYGTTFYSSSEQYLPTVYSGALETRGTTFNECGEVFPSSGIMEYCTFISAPNYALHMIKDNHIANTSFINCASGIHITESGSYTFSNMAFVGGTYDIVNDAPSGLVIINSVNSNPTTYVNLQSATTSILNSVFLTVNTEDEDGNDVNGAQVAIYTVSGGQIQTELMNEATAGGQAQTEYNYLGDQNIEVRVRRSSTGTTRYFPYKTSGTIDDGGYTLTAVLIEDSIVAA